jgi:MarR family 2-MHQ and catechol resistance regulon transcriptional repressor
MPQAADVSTPKLVIVLMRASHSLAEFLEAGLAREGIHNPDFAILEALLHKGPLAMSAIEQKVRQATAPLKTALDRLRRRGMVRGQSDRDRFQAASFELTEEGRKTITRIYARHTEDIEAVMRVLSPGERRPLWQALKKIGIQGERRGRSGPLTQGDLPLISSVAMTKASSDAMYAPLGPSVLTLPAVH